MENGTPQSDANPSVVVITGASSGIGRETALRYAGRHDCLVLAARSEGALQQVADECRSAGAAEVIVVTTDISDADEVQRLFDAAVAHFRRVDIVVQSAAVTAFGRFEDLPVDVFDGIVRTNIQGAANVARSAITHFRGRGTGHLVLVGSLLGAMAVPYQSAYVVSKFATNGLVRALRQESRDVPGVKVHGVYPGPVDTPVYGTAANYLGLTPRVPPTADAPGVVAAMIVRATMRRRSSERQIGLVNWPAIAVYRLLPTVFDALIGPLLRAVSFTSEAADPAKGNVLISSSSARPPKD